MFNRIKKAFNMLEDDKSYMTIRRDCHIEDSIVRNILLRTIRLFSQTEIISCIYFRNINFSPAIFKLLSSGMKHTKVEDLKIVNCEFSNISIVGLNDMFSNLKRAVVESLYIRNFREREAFALMIKDLEKNDITIYLKRNVFGIEDERKEKNIILMHLAGFERNKHDFSNFCNLKFEVAICNIYPEPDFLLKIFNQKVSFIHREYKYTCFSEYFRYET